MNVSILKGIFHFTASEGKAREESTWQNFPFPHSKIRKLNEKFIDAQQAEY